MARGAEQVYAVDSQAWQRCGDASDASSLAHVASQLESWPYLSLTEPSSQSVEPWVGRYLGRINTPSGL